jgi:hypothetical protein
MNFILLLLLLLLLGGCYMSHICCQVSMLAAVASHATRRARGAADQFGAVRAVLHMLGCCGVCTAGGENI